jgi:quercetin dioxygenase-like cupin family protein
VLPPRRTLRGMKAFLSILSVVAITFCLAGRASAQDPVQIAPKVYKVTFNNDRVRVLDVRLKPGEKSAMHSHPDYLVYAFSSSKVKFTMADGKTADVSLKGGECQWRKAEKHAVENVGKTDVHVLNIEFKK